MIVTEKGYYITNLRETRKKLCISESEKELLLLSKSGMLVKGIVRQLCLSENTIKTKRKRLFKKLGRHKYDGCDDQDGILWPLVMHNSGVQIASVHMLLV